MQFRTGHTPSNQRIFAYLILVLGSGVVWGGGLVCGLVYRFTLHRSERYRRAGLILSLLWMLGVWGTMLLLGQVPGYLAWQVLTIPSAPIVARLTDMIVPWVQRTFATDLDERLRYFIEDEQNALERRRRAAANRKRPPMIADHLLIAPVIEMEEKLPGHTGLHVDKGWLYLRKKALFQHLFIMGGIGSGKTEQIKYLVSQLLLHTTCDVFVIDGKGDDEIADFVMEATETYRGFRPPIFRLGHGVDGDPYNAFIGDGDDIYNRLLGMIYGGVDMSKVTTGQKHYLDINKCLLDLICKSHMGAPVDFRDLRQRLSRHWLVHTYRKNKADMEDVRRVVKHVDSLALALQPLIRDFKDRVTCQGFTLDEAGVGIFSVRTQSVGETGRQLLQIFNEDLMDFMGKRQKRETIIIVDEFQAFNSEALVGALSLGRSAGLGLVLATQDIGSLLNEKIQRQIKANAKTKILMATDMPEELGELAGTKQVFEHSYQHEEGQVTGVGTSRVQHQHRVSLNDVARLHPGEGFLIRQRYTTRLQFRMAACDHQEIRREERRVSRATA